MNMLSNAHRPARRGVVSESFSGWRPSLEVGGTTRVSDLGEDSCCGVLQAVRTGVASANREPHPELNEGYCGLVSEVSRTPAPNDKGFD